MVVKIMRKNKPAKENGVRESSDEVSPEKVPKDVLVIAQEIRMVKSLGCNDLVKRNRQLKKLRKWMELRSKSSFPFQKDDLKRIWKGLYYSMWMSDKPLVQEELAEQLGQLFGCFGGDVKLSIDFFGAFLFTMCCQWFGIDQWRLDKFMMLVRRMLRHMLRVLKNAGWREEDIKHFNEELKETVLADNVRIGSTGLTMHFLDIFCEELAKVAEGNISPEGVGEFMKAFVVFYCTQPDFKLTSHCRTRVFYQMLYQSGLGREYSEKYNAWKEMGFPSASINDLEKAETGEDNEDESDDRREGDGCSNEEGNVLDPRAGNVDVFVAELPLDGKHIIEALQPFVYKYECSTKRRKSFKKILQIFETYQRGEFPLGVKRVPRINLRPEEEVVEEQIANLEDTENSLYGAGRELKKLNKRNRKKLLKSINFEEIDDERVDDVIMQAIPSQRNSSKKARRKLKRKRQNSLSSNWVEEELDVEELSRTKKQKNSDSDKDRILEGEQPKDVATESPLKTCNSETQKGEKENDAESKKKSAWDEPLAEGEIEYFQPSRKKVLQRANSDLRLNPLAMKKKFAAAATAQDAGNDISQQSPNDFKLIARKQKNAKTPVGLSPLAMKKHYAAAIKASPFKSNSAASSVPSTPLSNLRGKAQLKADSSKLPSPKTPISATKRVKIALKLNSAQHPSEYYRQLKSSPDIPYDANKKPSKGLLKPNSMPSPINPFYKKKIGLKFLNDTM